MSAGILIRLLSGSIYGSPSVYHEAFTTIERADPTGCALCHRYQVMLMGVVSQQPNLYIRTDPIQYSSAMFSHPWTRVRPIFDGLPQSSCVYYNVHLFCNVRCTPSTTTWTSVKAASLSLTRWTRRLPIAYHRASISLPFYSVRSCNQDNLLLLHVAGLSRMLMSGPHWEQAEPEFHPIQPCRYRVASRNGESA